MAAVNEAVANILCLAIAIFILQTYKTTIYTSIDGTMVS
jgi:hypothetical protein